MPPMTLLTIITESILEDTMIDEITALGAKGYTIIEAHGCGTHGLRTGKWSAGANIRIEVVGDTELCTRIVKKLQACYEENYGLLMYTSTVELQN